MRVQTNTCNEHHIASARIQHWTTNLNGLLESRHGAHMNTAYWVLHPCLGVDGDCQDWDKYASFIVTHGPPKYKLLVCSEASQLGWP